MKLTKMFYGNQYIGKFNCDGKKYSKKEIFVIKAKRFLRKLIKIIVLLSIITIACLIAVNYFPVEKEVAKYVQVDNLSLKVSELKNEVLNDLRSCESGGSKESDGLIVFDSNKVASIGNYQYQKKTVIHLYQKIYNQTITGKEAIQIALDEKKSRQLASDTIFGNVSGGIDNWYNCKNSKGLAEKIKWINKINEK